MKSKLSAILVILMMFIVSVGFNAYAEDNEITETSENVVIDENPIIPDMSENSAELNGLDRNESTLTVECRDNDEILSGMKWSIYKVAVIGENGMFIPTADFAGYNVNLNNLTTSETATAAETLEAYAHIDNIAPVNEGISDSNGIAEFNNLSFGLYLLSGDSITINGKYYLFSPSLVTLSGAEDDQDEWVYDVKVLPKKAVLGVNDRVFHYDAVVKKVWENDNEKNRPNSITAILVKDGKEFSRAILNEENNWTYTWNHLSSKYKWTVIEEDSLDDYTVTYYENHINVNPENPSEYDVEFVIVNTWNVLTTTAETKPIVQANNESVTTTTTVSKLLVEKPPVEKISAERSKSLPQTGQLWWPVPIFSALGLIIFAIGWKFNSNKRKNNEK